MATRINIDPVTRIEGHLRVDVEVNGGSISQAWASCTMWRGIENILLGRDPREAWLFTQRFCGVCTTVHAMASVRAVEDALRLPIPPNAQFIRNLILINHALHDHIVHFYQLSALDWVDIMTIPKANPKAASSLAETLSDWTNNSDKELGAAQDKVKALAASGQLGMFASGYWGHPAMHLPPEVNLIAFSHYLQALDYQRKALQVVGILGGKTPHIQNLAVGGVMNAINLDSQGTLNMDRLYTIKSLMDEVIPFVQQVYFNDACAIAALYPEWMSYGGGVRNYLAVPDLPLNAQASAFDLPGGVIMDGNLSGAKTFYTAADTEFRHAVTEDLTHAWYKGNEPQHPWQGETQPQYTEFEENGKYSWVKAPRYDGHPMQVGPLSQVLIGYAQGHPLTKKWTDLALAKISAIGKRKVTVNDLQSTMGRHVARAIRCAMLTELAAKHWDYLVTNISSGDTAVYNPPKFPDGEIEGVGTHEAPRGTLSHWVVVKNGKLSNYQAVVPTTWNASPRDNRGQPVRDVADWQSHRRSREAAGSAAHRAFVRSLHGLRMPHPRSGREAHRHGESTVIPRILIAGVGNVLLEDDGFGPHAIARLQAEYELGSEVELLDLGTPGLDFVDYLVGRDVLIIVDALSTGGEPGEILTFDRQQLRDYMPNMRLSAHQPCLQETLFTAETADVCPEEVLLVGVVGEHFDVTTELSQDVEEAMPAALELIAELVRQHRGSARKRLIPLPASSWWTVSQTA